MSIEPTRSTLQQKPPAPLEPLRNRVIHPRNIEIEGRGPLPSKELRRAKSELKLLERQLNRAGYGDMLQQFQHVKSQQERVLRVIETVEAHVAQNGPSEDMTTRLTKAQRAKKNNALRLNHLYRQIDTLRPLAQKRRDLLVQINMTEASRKRAKLQQKLEKEVRQESLEFAAIITERLQRLGYCYKFTDAKGRTKVRNIRFREVHAVGLIELWYLIDTSVKRVLGSWDSTLPEGVKLSDILSEETLYELSLACNRQVRTVPVEENKNYGAWLIVSRVGGRDGIPEHVNLSDVLANYPAKEAAKLPIGIGVARGAVINWIHLVNHPHLLIGGSTGGGKSNAINVIISTLISKHPPSTVQFALIDLKEGNEFQFFEKIPHLLMPVVTEAEDAARVLAQLETLRKERSRQFHGVFARTIDEYNAEVRPEKRMARIVVIVDEYAAIKGVKDLESAINSSMLQLLNKGRAVGIHVILCTQNPSVDVIPGTHKANMVFRLAAPMPTASASQTVLGTGDAAKLPNIPGRMVAMVGAKTWHIQVPEAHRSDIETAIAIANEYDPAPPIELPEHQTFVGFTEEKLIETALNYFEGALSARKIWELVRSTENVSYPELGRMVKALKERDEIYHNGQVYHLIPNGPGHRLELDDCKFAGLQGGVMSLQTNPQIPLQTIAGD